MGRRSDTSNESPKRTAWANLTRERMIDVSLRIKSLQEELAIIRAQCNHTMEDGTSALLRTEDDDGSWTQCTVCGGY